MTILKTFGLSVVAFTVLDFLWFKFVVKDFNLKELAEIGRIKNGEFDILVGPAIVTYLLMALAMAVFVVPSFAPQDPWWKTFLTGALLGLIIYGIFDLTNLAILKNYPVKFVVVDVTWGTCVFGVVSCLSHWAVKT
ncbi:MAG: DUF2177 family protein [Bdellovibrionaceae bacterium]|nr:DUF2177 family protein [Pseudobdellovibrionaceae bacterium]